jgi:TonB family protein
MPDSTGKVLVENGNGKWLTFIDERFKSFVEGDVSDGVEEGEWLGKRNDTINIVYQYKNGELKSCADIDKSGQKTYSKLEVVPEFPGGLDAFGKYLGHNIHYPADARLNATQGRVIISFIVNKDGNLTDIKVARGIGDGCDQEALRVINLSPPWKPGMQGGKPVRVAYSVPISFTLGN